MGPRIFLTVCFAALGAASLAAVAVGTWLIATELPETGSAITNVVIVYGGGIAFLLVAVIAMLWGYLDHAIAQPLAAVVRGIQTVLHANPDHRIEIEDIHHLGGLPKAVNELIRQLALARSTVDEEITKATIRLEEQKDQLAVILQDLHEGVIVCDLNHRILLYNNRALELLRIAGDMGLDRSLLHFMTRQPILHALSRLQTRLIDKRYHTSDDSSMVAFVGATTDGRYTLEGRMSLMLGPNETPKGYVISFEDGSEELAALGLRDRLLREATEGLRAPVGNLHAAAEILSANDDLRADEQGEFKRVILRESHYLCERLESLAAQYRDLITGHWPMSDLYSSNLFQAIIGRLRERLNLGVMITGIPQWLHGDSYTLVQLLERLIVRTSEHLATEAFDVEAVAGERHIYLDLVWTGSPVPAGILHAWQNEHLEEALGGLTLRDVLERHKTDIWSLSDRDGRARLRLPLPPPKRVTAVRDMRNRQARPEFYDFELLKRPRDLGELGKRPLKSINYVVFDTETTGLEPSGGDEIVAIAGVRVVNGRILTGESFERIVDPRRSIPVDSMRFHGISDEMVKDKPPIQVVLPQFRAFVGDAVLVAHNAAFDLKFLKLKEAECGVTFDMPVLDTLLMSVFVHDYTTRHNLEAIAQRFGIPVQGRHSALGDSLVTAGVFLKMIELLESRDVMTLDQAIEASQTIVEVRAKQAAF
jgi:DNA polymerase-3 subunit epsilon